ncbi:hypothetical protein FKW77_007548 [Venturia effusa]|uniref:Killer toxin Kp4 domain-containing protein n=1 Tax=Venturia effusa TaxID=50376 RepID=A0A517KWU0_9PEZI|nr:hypothetical protein FKW77_007548 [Venturia effusa]
MHLSPATSSSSLLPAVLVAVALSTLSTLSSAKDCGHLQTTFYLANPAKTLPPTPNYYDAFAKNADAFYQFVKDYGHGDRCPGRCGGIQQTQIKNEYGELLPTYQMICRAPRVNKKAVKIQSDMSLQGLTVRNDTACDVNCTPNHHQTCFFHLMVR